MNPRQRLSTGLAAFTALTLTGGEALAATCDVAACSTQLQSAGVLVNDIFRDANNNDGQHLPSYGKLINNWPNCPERVDFAGAAQSLAPFDCPGEYVGLSTAPTVANANAFLGAVDREVWQPCRLADATIQNGCVANWSCIADGTGGNYTPWTGLVFDLQGPSNKVALFGENDHGPQPCESLEYTVFLSDNPYAQEQVLDPANQGIDAAKWNRAVLSNVYTGGWVQVRPPDPVDHGASCGDTSQYSVEEDSFVQVFSLPCGITLRYASIVAGNDGHDFPSCAYDSNEGEVDAIAGLTDSGAGVCPDSDGDHYVDCLCPGAPAVCDCNDADPTVHPGAPEACDGSADLNCDGVMGTPCGEGLACYQGLCVPTCLGQGVPFCPDGSDCQSTPQGNLCVPEDCACAPGMVCINSQCVDACAKIKCPGSEVCSFGHCADPCANVQCKAGQVCNAGQCVGGCGCFVGDSACSSGLACDSGNTNMCVAPSCKGVSCPAGQTCDPSQGKCVDFCNPSVACPQGQKCMDAMGCVPNCQGVVCSGNLTCDPKTGLCTDIACNGVQCTPPEVCVMGACVAPNTGSGAGGSGSGGAGGSGTGIGGGGGGNGGAGTVSGTASTGSGTGIGGGGGGNGGAGTVSGTASTGSGIGGGGGGAGSVSGTTSTGSGTGGLPDSSSTSPADSPGSTGGCGCEIAGDQGKRSVPPAIALALLGLVTAVRKRRPAVRWGRACR